MKPFARLHPALFLALLLPLVAAAPAGGDEAALVHRTHAIHALVDGAVPVRAPLLGLGLRGQSFLRTLPGMAEDEDDDEETAVRAFNPGEVVDLLRALVSGLGDGEGESIEAEEGRLLVTTTPARQAQIDRLLQRFWAEAATRIEVKLERVRLAPEAVGRLTPSALALLRHGHVPAVEHPRLMAAFEEAGARVETAGGLVRPSGLAVLGHVRRVRYLRDYDVEIAQDSKVGDPQVDTLSTGWAVEVRPFLLSDGTVLLEAFGQTASEVAPLRKLSLETKPFGAIDLPRVHVLRTTTRSHLQRSAARVLFVSEDEGRGVEAFIATTRVLPGGASGASGRRLDASALVMPRDERGLFGHPNDPGFWAREPRLVADVAPSFDDERLVEHVLARTAESIWERDGAWLGLQESGHLVVVGEDGVPTQVREMLHDAERATLASLRVRVLLSNVEPDGQARARQALCLDVPIQGRVVWQQGLEAAFLSDWGVEVAQEARVGDPIVETLFAGLDLELRATPSPLDDKALVRIDVRFSDVEEPFELVRAGNECTGPIEVPRTSAGGASQDLVIDIGASGAVSLGRLEDGREVHLECHVTR